MYDPALGRWHCVDPLAEKYISLSQYQYCNNNPIRFIDYDGKKFGDPKSEDTKRYKKSLRRTKTGRKILRGVRRNKKNIYIHYLSPDQNDTNDNLIEQMGNQAEGLVVSGKSYNKMAKGNEMEAFESDNTLNTETGEWEANGDEAHILINEDLITETANTRKIASESDVDVEIHGVEVHEGTHIMQSGYDGISVVKDSKTGKYKSTGKTIPYLKRKAEKEASKNQEKAKKELKQQL